jgi:hypothetical protein
VEFIGFHGATRLFGRDMCPPVCLTPVSDDRHAVALSGGDAREGAFDPVAMEVSGNVAPTRLAHTESRMLTPPVRELAWGVARMAFRNIDEFGLFR